MENSANELAMLWKPCLPGMREMAGTPLIASPPSSLHRNFGVIDHDVIFVVGAEVLVEGDGAGGEDGITDFGGGCGGDEQIIAAVGAGPVTEVKPVFAEDVLVVFDDFAANDHFFSA